MNSIIEMLLTGLVDPFIWIKSMSSLGCNKSKMKCFGAFLGYYLLLVGRDLLSGYLNSSMIGIIMSAALAVYIFVVTYVLFQGKLSEKILSVSIFFCILFLSELFTYELYAVLMDIEIHTPVKAQVLKIYYWFFVKLLQGGLCYWIFKSKTRGTLFQKNKETIAIVIAIASILSSILMLNASKKQSRSAAFIFQLIEILFIWYLACSLVELRKKEKSISLLNKEVSDMDEKKENVRDVDQFRHDYASNAFVMKNLCNYKEYDKLGVYMDKVFTDTVRVEVVFEHPNFAIQIIISNLLEIAKKIRIPFSAEISVNEFHMKDEDICGILYNLVISALRDSVRVTRSKAHVFLKVMIADNTYKIQCINEIVAVDDFTGTFMQNQEEENLEFLIVEEIVKRYHGDMERECIIKDKMTWSREVVVRVPV